VKKDSQYVKIVYYAVNLLTAVLGATHLNTLMLMEQNRLIYQKLVIKEAVVV
jgi:hypothetical protein